jgi:AhpC/TSA family
MTMFRTERARRVLQVAVLLMMLSLVGAPGLVSAVEVGEPAPGFTLPATTGADISLSDFKGKKWVLLEFYGADFSPT